MKSLLAILCLVLVFEHGLCGLQGYAVKGRLLCGTSPASKVKVKLIDIDTGSDDVMDTKTTDNSGNFELRGQTSEITDIDPVLKIYHDCLDGVKPGQRRWKLDLPKKYIAKSGAQAKVVDVGILNLEPKMHEEEREVLG